jgi:hypothetical protein
MFSILLLNVSGGLTPKEILGKFTQYASPSSEKPCFICPKGTSAKAHKKYIEAVFKSNASYSV